MVSRYTNVVLTVIAAAMCAIVYQNAASDAYAKEASCGAFTNPCYVRGETGAGLEVKVTNWP